MHNEGSKTGKHVHLVDGVPALQMDIVNQHYLSSSYAKLQFKLQKPPLAGNHPVGPGGAFPDGRHLPACQSALGQKGN